MEPLTSAAADDVHERLARLRLPGAPARKLLDVPRLESAARLAVALWDAGAHVAFPPEFGRGHPVLQVRDGGAAVRVRFPATPPRDPVALGLVVEEEGALAEKAGDGPWVLGLDHAARGLSRVQLETALYGEATYFHPPAYPPAADPAEPLIAAALRRGWRDVLNLHNLLPQNRLLVMPEDRGIFPRVPEAGHLAGVLTLHPTGDVRFAPNPFSPHASPRMLRRFSEDTRMGCI